QRLDSLNAVTRSVEFGIPFRVMPGGKEVVFIGRPADSSAEAEALWVLNLQTGGCELLNPDPPRRLLEWASPPYAPDPAAHSILPVETVSHTYRILRGARRNYANRHPMLTLTLAPIDLDIASDGSLYLDQVERPLEILRFSNSNKVERLSLS